MDRIFGHLDASRRERARKLCSLAGAVLEAHASRLDPGTAESARLAPEALLSNYGLTDEQIVALSLDSAAATEKVLSKARFTSDERIEISRICRDLLRCFYKYLPEDPELLIPIRCLGLARMPSCSDSLDEN
jgi:hypothetical protein